jgi:hypothetical protein
MLTGWILVVLLTTADRYQIMGIYATERECEKFRERLMVHVYRSEQRSMQCVAVAEARQWK